MAKDKKRSLRKAARELTGARAATRLAQRSQAEDPDDIQKAINLARDAFIKLSKHRKVPPELERDPLASLRVYEELRKEDRSSKVELNRTNRQNLNQPYIAEVRLSAATLVTTILIPLFTSLLGPGTEELSDKEKRALASDFAEIGRKFGDETVGLLRDALKVRAINLGGPVSRAYAQPQREASRQKTEAELIKEEDNRIADFLDIFSRVPGHSKISKIPGDPETAGIAPEAVFIPLARRVELLDRIVGNPNTPSQEKARILESTRKIYIPLAAEWRQRAYNENKPDLAATFNALKARMRDQILQIEDPKGYQKTSTLILKMAQAIAPERAKPWVTDLKSARALVLAPMADEIHALMGELRDRNDPRDLRDFCIVQARIKSVASTYDELKRLGFDIHALNLDGAGPLPRVFAMLPKIDHSWWQKGANKIIENLRKENVIVHEDEKLLLEVFVEMRDGLGFRVVQRIPTSPEDSKEKVEGMEAKEINKLHNGLKKIIKDDGKYIYEDGREKNLYDAKVRKEFFKKRRREDNGYVTIQDGVRYLGIPIEIQCRSERAHDEAELGKATSHDRYKQDIKPRDADDDERPDTDSPVFTDINEIRRVGRDGGTGKKGAVADFLAEYYRNSIDPALAFSTASIKVVRLLHYFDPDLIPAPGDNDLSTPLMPNDRVICTMDTELRYDPRQREAVIAACNLKDASEFLKSLHIDLAHNEANRPGSRRSNPPSSYDI